MYRLGFWFLFQSNISFYIVDCNSTLFFVDFPGVLRTGRNITEEDAPVHVLKVGPDNNYMLT